MKLITKTMVGTLTTATVAGTVLWGTLTFTGSEDLTFIKDKFDWVKLQYENVLLSIRAEIINAILIELSFKLSSSTNLDTILIY